jgi:hypothetical protein
MGSSRGLHALGGPSARPQRAGPDIQVYKTSRAKNLTGRPWPGLFEFFIALLLINSLIHFLKSEL